MPDENTNQDQEAPIVDVATLNQDLPADYAEQKIKEEEAADEDKVGGTGSQYDVPTGSYAEFKNAVNGNGYDIDNHYGWQCWDGAALLWQQLGKSLVTGNGLAIGCWDLKRDLNKYDLFDLVTDANTLQPGDVVAMRPNHIGFFDGYDGEYMRILAQNQGGKTGPNGGRAFNLVRIVKSAFAGAFRYKKWAAAQAPSKSNDQVADEVLAGQWGNGKERRDKLTAAGYDYGAIQAIVNARVGNPPAAPRKSNEVVAQEVIAGAWGNGADRKTRLEAAGYSYAAVQAVVDEKVAAKLSNEQVADQVIAGAWGNGDDRRNRLVAAGYDYNAVQSIVNTLLAKNSVAKASNEEVANQVIHGDWGNGQDRKDRLAKAGYDYATIQALVNRKLGF